MLEQLDDLRRVELADKDRRRSLTSPRYAHPIPPMWNIGSGVRLIDSESKAQTSALRYAAARLRCVVRTPLGRPVVPDVYICTEHPRRAAMSRIRRGVRSQTALILRACLHHLQPLRNACGDLPGHVPVARAGDHHRATGVGDDRLEFRRCQSPVERDGHGPDLACGEQKLHDFRSGAVEVSDAIPGVHAGGEQRLRQAARAIVELGVGQRTSAAADRDHVRTVRRVFAHDVGDPQFIQNLH